MGIRGDKFLMLKKYIAPLYQQIVEVNSRLCSEFGEDFFDPVRPLSDFPESYAWNEESMGSLENVLPHLNVIILMKVFEYFYKLYRHHEIDESAMNRIGNKVQYIIKSRRC